MEGNVCDINHLEEEIIPPPRKRLLAGFKKQISSDQSCASASESPPTPTEVDVRVKSMLSSVGSGTSSLEEIAESSKKAAEAASEVAKAARGVAEEKAAVAAKAIAVAKSALDLVATFYEETSGRDRHTKRNKSKKQVTVRSLYKERDGVENGNCKTDETEQEMHQVIHGSSVSSKHSPLSSDSKNHKHKKLKVSPVTGKLKFPNDGLPEGDSHSLAIDSECSSREVSTALENEKRTQCLTKLITSNWRVEKDMVAHKRKARKQLIHTIERRVDLS